MEVQYRHKQFQQHIQQQTKLGVFPFINSTEVGFGAIDIDDYSVNHTEIIDKLKLINTECKINSIDKNIDSLNLKSLKECSIVVDATDDWLTSKLLNEYCLKNSINFLYSSAVRHDLQIILFNNSKTTNHLCLNCIFPNKDDVDLPRCTTVGISGISAGLAGLITAQKIINFSLNLKDETNILTISDGKKLSIDNIIIKSKHDCYLNSI